MLAKASPTAAIAQRCHPTKAATRSTISGRPARGSGRRRPARARLAAERVRQALPELRADVRVARRPLDQRRAAQLAEPLAVRAPAPPAARRGRAEHRPLGAVVELVEGAVGDLASGSGAPEGAAGGEPHRAARRPAAYARRARRGASGSRARTGRTRSAPAARRARAAAARARARPSPSRASRACTRSRPSAVAERLEEAVVAGDRVVEVAGLAGAAEAGQVGRDPAGAREERLPVPARRRHAVQVERSARRPAWRQSTSTPATSAGARRSPPAPSYHPRAMADRRRLRRITDRLANEYGRPRAAPPPRARRRAGADGAVAEHQRPQPRRRLLRGCASASRPGTRCATRPSTRSRRRSAPAAWRRPSRCASSAILDAIGDDDLSGSPTRRSTRRASYLSSSPGVGPQDRRLRAAVLLRPPRRARRHARLPRRRAARPVAAEGAARQARTTSSPASAATTASSPTRRTCC